MHAPSLFRTMQVLTRDVGGELGSYLYRLCFVQKEQKLLDRTWSQIAQHTTLAINKHVIMQQILTSTRGARM